MENTAVIAARKYFLLRELFVREGIIIIPDAGHFIKQGLILKRVVRNDEDI
jgi:hypothetical protein